MALNNKVQMSTDNSFEGYMKGKGTAVKEFEGDWRDMSAQNLAMFRDAYNYYNPFDYTSLLFLYESG